MTSKEKLRKITSALFDLVEELVPLELHKDGKIYELSSLNSQYAVYGVKSNKDYRGKIGISKEPSVKIKHSKSIAEIAKAVDLLSAVKL